MYGNGGVGVGVTVDVGLAVAVGRRVCVGLGVSVDVGVGKRTGVKVAVGVREGNGIAVRTGIKVDVAASVAIDTDVSVGGMGVGVARQAIAAVTSPRLTITASDAWTRLCANLAPILYPLVPRPLPPVRTPGKLGQWTSPFLVEDQLEHD